MAPSCPGRDHVPLHPHALNWDEPHYPQCIPLLVSLRSSAGGLDAGVRALSQSQLGSQSVGSQQGPSTTCPSFCAPHFCVSPVPPPLPLLSPCLPPGLTSPSASLAPPAVVPSPVQAVGQGAVGLVLWAGRQPRARTEPRGDGRAPAGADQHRRGAALENRLQCQCHPAPGPQHLPLGLFCLTPQTWLQWRPSKLDWSLASLSCCGNRGPWRPSQQEPLSQAAHQPRGEATWRKGDQRGLWVCSGPHSRTHTGSSDSSSLSILLPMFLPQKHCSHPLGASFQELLLYLCVEA